MTAPSLRYPTTLARYGDQLLMSDPNSTHTSAAAQNYPSQPRASKPRKGASIAVRNAPDEHRSKTSPPPRKCHRRAPPIRRKKRG